MSSSRLLVAHDAATRLLAAAAWLKARPKAERLLVLTPRGEAAAELTRQVVSDSGSSFGWERHSPGRLARIIAGQSLAEAGLTPLGIWPWRPYAPVSFTMSMVDWVGSSP